MQMLDQQHHAVVPAHPHPRARLGVRSLGEPFAVAVFNPALATGDAPG